MHILKQETITKPPYECNNYLRFHWDILTICNYNCFYCYRRQESGWGIYDNVYKKVLANLSQVSKDFQIVLLGGEPTLHSKINEILTTLDNHKHCKSLSIISNGRYSKIYEVFKPNNPFLVQITFHPSEVNNMNDFFNNILKIKKLHDVRINVMLVPNYYDKIKECLEFIKKESIDFCYNVLFNPKTPELFMNYKNKDVLDLPNLYKPERILKYNINNKEYYYSDIDTFKNIELSNFKGFKCYNYNIQISVQGDFTRFCNDKPLTINEINNLNDYILCPLKYCTCQGKLSTLKIPK
ncbi:radical SAM domain-containing protein [Campylobacter phage CP21]|uniref:Radical SAM domain-containing protein n=1 Tax=Campylobacter phage CP21 TaxID=2881391 RepID=I7JVQ6_9CAUD|nr:radical SAM domain-containing protein [Campylobacter phage CP21]CCH63489.1 radical SAM domain-containing protein [Campylobacter phage CP21]